MVYKSRAKRRDEACALLSETVEKLGEISDYLENIEEPLEDIETEEIEEVKEIKDKEQVVKKITDAKTLIEELSPGDLEDLKDEMESWASNMEGTSLEYTSKYETVSETASALEDVISDIESISVPEIDMTKLTIESIKDFAGEVKDIIDTIESALGDAENIDFPGMYG